MGTKVTIGQMRALAVVAAIMGWSPSTTAKMVKRYGHIGNDVRRAALDSLVDGPKSTRQSAASAPHKGQDSQRNS